MCTVYKPNSFFVDIFRICVLINERMEMPIRSTFRDIHQAVRDGEFVTFGPISGGPATSPLQQLARTIEPVSKLLKGLRNVGMAHWREDVGWTNSGLMSQFWWIMALLKTGRSTLHTTT